MGLAAARGGTKRRPTFKVRLNGRHTSCLSVVQMEFGSSRPRALHLKRNPRILTLRCCLEEGK
jgi:hypothetical protein